MALHAANSECLKCFLGYVLHPRCLQGKAELKSVALLLWQVCFDGRFCFDGRYEALSAYID